MSTTAVKPVTIEDFKSRQELLEAGLPAFEKSRLLQQWDAAHKGQPAEAPRLNSQERESLADYAVKLRALREGHIKLAGLLEKYRQEADKNKTEVRRLEETLEPSDTAGIQTLVFQRCRQEILDKFVNKAPKRLTEIDLAVQSCSSSVDKILARRFGTDLRPGGRFFGPSAIPSKCDMVLAEIERALDR